MKAITSKVELLKKLKKNNLLTDGRQFYLSDFHKSKVGKSVAYRAISERLVEPDNAVKEWFEKEFRLRRPVWEYKRIEIFKDDAAEPFHYFFHIKKKKFIKQSFQSCCEEIDHLKRKIKLKEKNVKSSD